jgi:hypothetical protein
MSGSRIRSGPILGALVVGWVAVGGCAMSPPVEVPPEAELVWLGQIDKSSDVGDFGLVVHHQAGQVYLVDDANGRVEGVNSVSAGDPPFTFNNVPPKRYRLYFIPAPPTTLPATANHY